MIFARRTPLVTVGSFRDFEFLGRRFAFIEQTIDRNFQRPRVFLKRLDRGDSVTILDAGRVAAQTTGALFHVTLREILCFAELSKAFTDNHAAIVTSEMVSIN